jgi:transcriptional regulator of aromatic amino acid metabolism
MPADRLDFDGLLHGSADAWFAVNARRRLVFLNRACAEVLGVQADEVLGLECKAHGLAEPVDLAAVVARCCPPPEALAGKPCSSPALLLHRGGQQAWRSIQWIPMADGAGSVAVVLGRIGPAAEDEKPPRCPESLPAALARLRHELLERFGFDRVIAVCPAMQRALLQARLASQSDVPVLLRGEPGTGKEHFARVIHSQSAAKQRPLVALDCAGLPAGTLERVLFDETKPGAQYLASPGQLPRDLQARVFEQARRGGVRLLAGTNTDLAAAVADGTFLPELFYHLSTLVIELPPLRQRQADLPLLAQQIIERCNADGERQVTGLTPAARELLVSHPWPGNLDELQEALTAAHRHSRQAEVDASDFPLACRAAAERAELPQAVPPRPLPLDHLLEQAERRLIELALRDARGNISKAAARLAVSRPRLYRRMEQLGLVQVSGGDQTEKLGDEAIGPSDKEAEGP